MERSKVNRAYNAQYNIIDINLSIFNLPDPNINQVSWSIMSPQNIIKYQNIDYDQSIVQNKLKYIAINFEYRGEMDVFSTENIMKGDSRDPKTLCRDLDIETLHLDLESHKRFEIVEEMINGSQMGSLMAISSNQIQKYTMVIELNDELYCDEACEKIFDFLTNVAKFNLTSVRIDVLTEKNAQFLRMMLMAIVYSDYNDLHMDAHLETKYLDEDDDDAFYWPSLTDFMDDEFVDCSFTDRVDNNAEAYTFGLFYGCELLFIS